MMRSRGSRMKSVNGDRACEKWMGITERIKQNIFDTAIDRIRRACYNVNNKSLSGYGAADKILHNGGFSPESG